MSEGRAPIGAEARGRLRVWLRAASARYARVEALIHNRDVHKYAIALATRKAERTRSFLALKRAVGDAGWLERAPERDGVPMAVFAVLKPRGAVAVAWEGGLPVDAGDLQDCVCINYLVFGLSPYPVRDGLWTAEVQEHALGRLLQRHPKADLDAALLELHRNLTRAAAAAARALLRAGKPLLVPAAQGVFLCEMSIAADVSLGGREIAHARAKTWLSLDQLRDTPEREIVPPATSLRDEPLGDSLLRPAPVQLEGCAVPGLVAKGADGGWGFAKPGLAPRIRPPRSPAPSPAPPK